MSYEPELLTRISELIRRALNFNIPSPDTDLIGSGLVDSLALVTLLVQLEEDFACELPLDSFDLDCFRSAESIAELVTSLGWSNGR